MLKAKCRQLWQSWDQFWFAPQSLYAVSLARMILAINMLIMYSIRFSEFSWFYSEQGMLPLKVHRIFMPENYEPLIQIFFRNEVMAWWGHLFFLVLLVLLALGVLGRVGTFAAFLLHIGFLQRNFSIIYGADLFNVFWLLYLSLVKHNTYFSVLNYLPRLKKDSLKSDMLSSVGIRLIQVQLCVSYAYTGIEKLKGNQWWEGTAVWYVLGMNEFLAGDFSFLQNFPLIIAALTIVTVVFEIYFPAAMIYKPIRKYWLLIGFGFHVSTALFMNLPFFCITMVTPYLLFFTEDEIKSVLRRVKLA